MAKVLMRRGCSVSATAKSFVTAHTLILFGEAFLAICTIHSAVGWRVMPASVSRRVSNSLNNVDLAFNKMFTMAWERHTLSYRLDLYNALNHRNYGIPAANINSPAFANEGAAAGRTDNLLFRRIVMGIRYQF
jgi:hypothetical protein